MALRKTQIGFPFLKGINQKPSEKSQAAGELTDCKNFRMDKTGKLDRRFGFDRLSKTAAVMTGTTGTIGDVKAMAHLGDEVLVFDGEEVFSKPTDDKWVKQGDVLNIRNESKFINRDIQSTSGTLTYAISGDYEYAAWAEQPYSADGVGNDVGAGLSGSGHDVRYKYLVRDRHTGATVVPTTEIASVSQSFAFGAISAASGTTITGTGFDHSVLVGNYVWVSSDAGFETTKLLVNAVTNTSITLTSSIGLTHTTNIVMQVYKDTGGDSLFWAPRIRLVAIPGTGRVWLFYQGQQQVLRASASTVLGTTTNLEFSSPTVLHTFAVENGAYPGWDVDWILTSNAAYTADSKGIAFFATGYHYATVTLYRESGASLASVDTLDIQTEGLHAGHYKHLRGGTSGLSSGVASTDKNAVSQPFIKVLHSTNSAGVPQADRDSRVLVGYMAGVLVGSTLSNVVPVVYCCDDELNVDWGSQLYTLGGTGVATDLCMARVGVGYGADAYFTDYIHLMAEMHSAVSPSTSSFAAPHTTRIVYTKLRASDGVRIEEAGLWSNVSVQSDGFIPPGSATVDGGGDGGDALYSFTSADPTADDVRLGNAGVIIGSPDSAPQYVTNHASIGTAFGDQLRVSNADYQGTVASPGNLLKIPDHGIGSGSYTIEFFMDLADVTSGNLGQTASTSGICCIGYDTTTRLDVTFYPGVDNVLRVRSMDAGVEKNMYFTYAWQTDVGTMKHWAICREVDTPTPGESRVSIHVDGDELPMAYGQTLGTSNVMDTVNYSDSSNSHFFLGGCNLQTGTYFGRPKEAVYDSVMITRSAKYPHGSPPSPVPSAPFSAGSGDSTTRNLKCYWWLSAAQPLTQPGTPLGGMPELPLHSMTFLADKSGRIHAHGVKGNGGLCTQLEYLTQQEGATTGTSRNMQGLASRVTDGRWETSGSTEFWCGGSMADLGANYGMYTHIQPALLKWDTDPYRPFRSESAHGVLYVTGGLLWSYDGNRFLENEFLLSPVIIRALHQALVTGTALDQGIYNYYVTYEYQDDEGVKHVSAPAGPAEVEIPDPTSSGSKQVEVQIALSELTNHRFSGKAGNPATYSVNVYRSNTDGTVHYLHATLGPDEWGDSFNPTAQVFTYVDADNTQHTDLSEVLVWDNVPAQLGGNPISSPVDIARHKDSLMVSNTENVLYSSLGLVSGLAAAFPGVVAENAGAYALYGDSFQSPITHIASNGPSFLFFSKDSVYGIDGDGPDSIGGGTWSRPVKVSEGQGVRPDGFVAETPLGVLYSSQNGIYLVGRDLQIANVGAAVDDYARSSAANDPLIFDASNEVVIPLWGGDSTDITDAINRTALVFNYFHKQWYRIELPSSIESGRNVEWRSWVDNNNNVVLYLCDSAGYLFKYKNASSTLPYADTITSSSAVPVSCSAETSWLQFPGYGGKMRVYKILMMGTFDPASDGTTTLALSSSTNFNGAAVNETFTNTITAAGIGAETQHSSSEVVMKPAQQKSESLRVAFTMDSGSAGKGWSPEGLLFEVGERPAATRFKVDSDKQAS